MARCNEEWLDTDLSEDIHDTLRMKERKMCAIRRISPLMHLRRYAIDCMVLTCQHFALHTTAQHLAICLYDRYTDLYDVSFCQMQPLVVACLLIACKYEEMDDKIPKFSTLLKVARWEVKASDYMRMELRVLVAFKWEIGFPTAPHFRDFYMQAALGADDLHDGHPLVGRQELQIHLGRNVDYFLEMSLLDQIFLEYRSSFIAAACLAAARTRLRITPTWTAELVQKTRYSYAQLQPCFEILLRMHNEGPYGAFPFPHSNAGSIPVASFIQPVAYYPFVVNQCAMQYTAGMHSGYGPSCPCGQDCASKRNE